MKKLSLILIPFLLASCENVTSSSEALSFPEDKKIACPSGAPALAFYEYLSKSNLEISNAQTVQGYFNENGDKDFVVLPTNAGVKMIQNLNAPFKLTATLTFGNFFLASTGNDEDSSFDENDYVVVFQQNQIPDLLFKYVYGENNNVHYVTDVSSAQRCLISGKDESNGNASIDYVLMAEPALSAALKQNSNASIYSNIQELYKEKSLGKEIMQASLFVKDNVSDKDLKDFKELISSSVTSLLSSPDILIEKTSLLGLEEEVIQQKIGNPSLNVNLLKNGNKIGLGFKDALENKESIDAFLETLNQKATTEDIYR